MRFYLRLLNVGNDASSADIAAHPAPECTIAMPCVREALELFGLIRQVKAAHSSRHGEDDPAIAQMSAVLMTLFGVDPTATVLRNE